MRRRRFLRAGVLASVALAGCTQSTNGDAEPPTSETETTTTQTTTRPEPTTVPGWDGDALNATALLDAHTARLTDANAYRMSVATENRTNGDVRIAVAVNATTDRVRGRASFPERASRDVYLAGDRSATRYEGEEPRYETNTGAYPADRQLAVFAAYANDDFGISLREPVGRFTFEYAGTATLDGGTVFRFESTGDASGNATLLVDRRGVLRKATFAAESSTTVFRYGDVGATDVAPPDWLSEVDGWGRDGEDTTPTSESPTATDDDVVVDVTALQWLWEFSFPDHGAHKAGDTLVLPVDEPALLRVTSGDVRHALSLPDFQTTVSATPGETNAARIRPEETGEYSFYCSEYCGKGHSEHTGVLRIVSRDEFEAWLAES